MPKPIGIRTPGTAWAWGNNSHGQLGNGTSTGSPAPVRVRGLDHVTQVSAGWGFSLALRSDGTVWARGWDDRAQLGSFGAPFSEVPVHVAGLSHATGISAGAEPRRKASSRAPLYIAGISAGGAHVLALKSNGTVLAWGNNQLNQLGIGSQASVTGSVQVTGLTRATQMAAGLDVSFAIRTVPYLVGL